MQTDILQMTHTFLLFFNISLKPTFGYVKGRESAQRATLPLFGAPDQGFHNQHVHIHCDGTHKITRIFC